MASRLAMLGLALLWLGLAGPSTPNPVQAVVPDELGVPAVSPRTSEHPQIPARPARARRPAQTDVRDQVFGPVLPESDPVTLTIPTLGVRSRLVQLGLDPDGAMEVPHDPARAGWYSRSAAPGALGPSVIAGHVTWNGAPGVFYRLGALRRGDRVRVSREDGRTALFSVSRVARFPKSRFPSHAVYGAIDHAGLRLITCGGSYDAARHRYLDNVVVFARLIHGPAR